MNSGLTITPTRHGGFVVTRSSSPQMAHELLFAGELDDCIAFVQRTFANHVWPIDADYAIAS